MDWEKIFANNVTNKGLISKAEKQFINSTQYPPKTTTTQSKIGQNI